MPFFASGESILWIATTIWRLDASLSAHYLAPAVAAVDGTMTKSSSRGPVVGVDNVALGLTAVVSSQRTLLLLCLAPRMMSHAPHCPTRPYASRDLTPISLKCRFRLCD
jgi:hypothetical protein